MEKNITSSQNLWFLNTLVTIHVPHERGSDGISALESLAPQGDSPPLHIHHKEDELFYVLDGEFTFQVGDEQHHRKAGESILGPKGIPHTFRVDSENGRWLVVTTNGDFERLVRKLGRMAEKLELPPPSGPPTPEQQKALAEAALKENIEIVGPPLH